MHQPRELVDAGESRGRFTRRAVKVRREQRIVVEIGKRHLMPSEVVSTVVAGEDAGVMKVRATRVKGLSFGVHRAKRCRAEDQIDWHSSRHAVARPTSARRAPGTPVCELLSTSFTFSMPSRPSLLHALLPLIRRAPFATMSSSLHPHDDPEQVPHTCPFHSQTNITAAPAQAHPTWHFPAFHSDAPEPSSILRDHYDQDESAYYFNNAYHAEPSPSAPSFLDNILNPVETSSFGYQFHNTDMSSSRGQGRPARLSNGYVDLTNDSPDVTTSSRKTKRESPTPGPSAKRVRRNDGTAAQQEAASPPATVEEIDLSDESQKVQDVLQKQREEAVKAQTQPEERPTTFTTFNCIICMDTPTDLTATACGMSPLCPYVESMLIMMQATSSATPASWKLL